MCCVPLDSPCPAPTRRRSSGSVVGRASAGSRHSIGRYLGGQGWERRWRTYLDLAVLMSLPRVLHAHDTFAAKRHCENLASALASYRERNGEYPPDLALLGEQPR